MITTEGPFASYNLVRADRDPEELARQFEPTSQSIRNWVGQTNRQEGPGRREATPWRACAG
jgi:transposase